MGFGPSSRIIVGIKTIEPSIRRSVCLSCRTLVPHHLRLLGGSSTSLYRTRSFASRPDAAVHGLRCLHHCEYAGIEQRPDRRSDRTVMHGIRNTKAVSDFTLEMAGSLYAVNQ